MIALLVGGTVVLCIGLLTVVFGIPIKEFSFGNTMILAGAVVSCTGLVLIGLYFVGREFRNLARRLDAGVAVPAPVALPREVAAAIPPRSQPLHEDTLFTRDQPRDRDRFADAPSSDDPVDVPSPLGPSAPPAWQDHPLTRARHPAPPAESQDPPAEPAERPRRNIMFSSHRRGDAKDRDLPSRDLSPPPLDDGDHSQPAEDYQHHDAAPEAANPFDHAWPQSSRSRPESSVTRNGRAAPPPADGDVPEPARERFQPPRRAEASSVTIVKSGVVDSMAYSLYSDGSIEAQMPEGMVRFASIDELRAHLDERG
jgi:hypothetical protein